MKRPSRVALAAAAVTGSLALALSLGAARPAIPGGAGRLAGSQGCLRCHEGIEDMHPAAPLSCVDCHGGNPEGRTKLEAHVPSELGAETDERIADLQHDLAWRRFRNPMDLRVARITCGGCHSDEVERVHTSLHGTTAGHLSDGYYEVGLLSDRHSAYSVFPVEVRGAPAGGLHRLVQVPAPRANQPADRFATHYADLPRKECMQCHLYSQGRAVRGRVGFDGDYRGEGCAACHVPYALDGLSDSADKSAVRNVPGHPRRHAMTRAPTTQTCTSCHYGDASIGLAFRGLSQLPPGAPGGPQIPGTTDVPLNRVFYLQDGAICPPDVHHERGMHCIDCHTGNDVMGDGVLHGKMDEAVEISCSACHGTFTRPSTLRTERGTPLVHMRREGERVILTSKVTGAEHPVPQVVHVLDPARPEYNERAAQAMTPEHERLECYTCHAGWNVNFLGFHFDRNLSLSQLDLLSGRRTPGRVTTQEKVFATWKSFYAGWNGRGKLAPYMTGFSTMGSVTDENGTRILDQVMPVTAAGLSGMTMIHHQTHTVRPTARSCVECHRAPSTFGLGSVNFRLGRQLAFVADGRGVEVVALDRARLAGSLPLAKVLVPDVVALEILADRLQGHAQYVFASEADRGVHVLDVRDPARPKRAGFVSSVAPRALALAGDHLYSADGPGGLKVYDVAEPARPRLVAVAPTFDARDVHVQWPYAYVADGPGGLAIYDVRAPEAPRLVSAVPLHRGPTVADAAVKVSVLFQYSRPVARDDGLPLDERLPARNLCAVLDESRGLVLVDVTEPTRPRLLLPPGQQRTGARPGQTASYRGLALSSHVDVAELQGGTRTAERDYAYVLRELRFANDVVTSELQVIELSEPSRPRRAGAIGAGDGTAMLALGSFYNPPILQTVIFTPGELGVLASDASLSNAPAALGRLPGIGSAKAIAIETFPLDEMRDEAGRPLKDVSHEGSRWLFREEIERVLSVPPERLGLTPEGEPPPPPVGASARNVFASLDRDGNGILEGDEAGGVLARSADADGDGLVTLLELARYGGTFAEERSRASATPQAQERDERANLRAELARLLDGIDPAAFDRDGDGRLSRQEAELALFSALDLDRSGWLDRHELSRQPGELRLLRYGGRESERLFASIDRSRDGRVSAREFKLRDELWAALDVDGDGYVTIPVPPGPRERRGMGPAPRSEWPARRAAPLPLPPVLAEGALEAAFDRDGDGALSARELRRRRDLLTALDLDRDGTVDANELRAALARVAARGVDATADEFEARWDLDGDGKLDERELPLSGALRARVLRGR